MINGRLTTREAARRLGVKPATLYAYVSRGLLHPDRTAEGSTFDVREVARLARTSRRPAGEVSGRPVRRSAGRPDVDPVFVTAVSCIDSGRLYYRGLDAVRLSREWTFEQVAEWLWSGPLAGPEATGWQVLPETSARIADAVASVPASASAIERFAVAVVAMSLMDDLRHDLNPAGVPVAGRMLLLALAEAVGVKRAQSAGGGVAERLWRRLAGRASASWGPAVLDAALVLAADHELAPSTLAARVAAGFRADPYAVVLTGLGPASGSWYPGSTGAPGEVEHLLDDASQLGAERAIGERLRRGVQVPHGFGMPLYPAGDPRGAEMLDRLGKAAPADRFEVVQRVLEVGSRRGFPPPNFDLGLGALSYCSGMPAGSGQAVFTLAKVAGWLAHAMEEYTRPTQFRSRADYVGPVPEATST